MAERTPDLADVERGVRSLCFAATPEPLVGVSGEAQALYRRLVRNSLFRVVKNAIPIAEGLLGAEDTERLITRFLDESPPTTRFLRQVPQEFSAWLSSLEDPPHHPALAELVHFEAVEIEVQQAPDAEPRLLPTAPDDDAGIEAHPSARLLAYRFPVFHMKKGSPLPSPTREPTFLVAYRADERMRWVKVPAVVAKTLALCGEGMTLGQALSALEEQHDGAVDRGVVRSRLTDLRHRGALLGFPKGGAA